MPVKFAATNRPANITEFTAVMVRSQKKYPMKYQKAKNTNFSKDVRGSLSAAFTRTANTLARLKTTSKASAPSTRPIETNVERVVFKNASKLT